MSSGRRVRSDDQRAHARKSGVDYWSLADLTSADVREMKHFLLDTCDNVIRWLPPPQWEPAWRSEAGRECANTERGLGGAWGEDTVRTVYAGGALYLDTVLRCIRAMADALTPETTPYVLNALARAAMEAYQPWRVAKRARGSE